MLLMRSVSAHLRQTTTHPLAPAQLGTLLKIGAGPCTLSELARRCPALVWTLASELR